MRNPKNLDSQAHSLSYFDGTSSIGGGKNDGYLISAIAGGDIRSPYCLGHDSGYRT